MAHCFRSSTAITTVSTPQYLSKAIPTVCVPQYSSTAITTVCTPQCSSNSTSDGASLPLVDGNHNGLHAAMLIEQRIGWRIASARRWQSQRFARRNGRRTAHWMAHCFRASTAITTVCTPQYLSKAIPTVCAPRGSSNSAWDGALLPLVDGNHNGLHAAMLVE